MLVRSEPDVMGGQEINIFFVFTRDMTLVLEVKWHNNNFKSVSIPLSLDFVNFFRFSRASSASHDARQNIKKNAVTF